MPTPRIIAYSRAQLNIDQFTKPFAIAGISPANPLTSQVTALDNLGNQIPVSLGWLEERLTTHQSTLFQWWLDEATDLRTRYRWLKDTAIQEYKLDGMTGSQKRRVLIALLKQFGSHMQSSTALMFVADMTGEFEDVAWDAIVDGGELARSISPTLLVLPIVRMSDMLAPRGEAIRFNGYFCLTQQKWKSAIDEALLKAHP